MTNGNKLSEEEIIEGQKESLKSNKTPDRLKKGLKEHLEEKGEL